MIIECGVLAMKKLRIRTVIILVGGLLFALLVIIFVAQLDKGMTQLLIQREKDNINQKTHIAAAILQSSMQTLPDITRDWSSWDATYDFVAGKNPEFVTDELGDYPFLLHKLNLITIFDKNGKIKYDRIYDFNQKNDIELNLDLSFMLEGIRDKVLYKFTGIQDMDLTDPNSIGVSGFMSSNGIWFYISAFPIFQSSEKGDTNGVFVFGRIIDDQEMARIQGGSDNIQMHRLSAEQAEDLFAQGHLVAEPYLVEYTDKGMVRGYFRLEAVYGDDLVIFLEEPRTLYLDGLRVIKTFKISIYLISCFILALLFFMMEKLLLAPLKDLAERVEKIDESSMSEMLPSYWGYELSTLVESLKKMLDKIAYTQGIIESQNENLRHIVHHDPLTGLPNRILCRTILEDALELAGENRSIVGFFYVNMINFKLINDTLGHIVGDMLLIQFGQRLTEHCPEALVIACLGGAEFAVIYGDCDETADVLARARAIKNAYREPFILGNREIRVAVAIGVSMFPADALDAEELHKNANIAANVAGMSRRSNYKFYDDSLLKEIADRLHIETALSKAVERDEFVPFFQPKLDLATNRITGSEALIRWFSPTGLIMPGSFISIADETGLIIQITWLMMEKACFENQRFAAEGFDISVSVNVPAQVILHTDFIHRTLSILEMTGMAPEKLDIEITEEALITDLEKNSKIMKELQSHGIAISVDDFGTGYSSLQYLKRMPFNTMKIDKAFVDGIPDDQDDIAIMRASVGIAKALKLKIVVEGVETLMQWDAIKEMGCDELQGYVISKPVPSDEFIGLLRKWNGSDSALLPDAELAEDPV